MNKPRRWRTARPHCGGWWYYIEKSEGFRPQDGAELVLLSDCGGEVCDDDDVEDYTGHPVNEDGSDFWVNYWSGTSTHADEMSGWWRECAKK